MVVFDEAFARTNQHEGGYVNDPDDRGGETYKGIARKFHPEWPGWKLIDTIKSFPDFKRQLDADQNLQNYVKEFYRVKFWLQIGGNSIPDQDIANEIYDIAVNMGVTTAVKYLQRSLNVLNCNGKHYADIAIDGTLGPKTSAAFQACLVKVGSKMLLNVINGFKMKHYLELMEKDPVNEKYVGWFKRVEVRWI